MAAPFAGTLKTGKLAGSMKRRCAFIPSKQAERPYLQCG